MKKLILLSTGFFSCLAFSQSRIVMAGNSYIVIDNAAKLVIDNPASNAIANSGTGGIMTEAEFDQIYWNVGASTGNYVIPYVSQAPIAQIPFSVNITAAGSGGGQLMFSTYPGPSFDNDLYKPSDVTHMFDYNTNSINNSSHVIDRFWIADANSYSSKPSALFQFTYRDQEHTQIGNTIVESDLGAQRFNAGPNVWGDYLPAGSTNAATNTTSGVLVLPGDFFRSWTLSELSNPLPVGLAYFKASCVSNKVVLSWQTLSEVNIDHFEIESLNESDVFISEGLISPTGGGEGVQDYVFYPQNLRPETFRLIEVSADGKRFVRSTVNSQCGQTEFTAGYSSQTNSLFLSFEAEYETVEPLFLYDAGGRLIHRTELNISKGTNNITIPDINLSNGMYLISFRNGDNQLTGRILATR